VQNLGSLMPKTLIVTPFKAEAKALGLTEYPDLLVCGQGKVRSALALNAKIAEFQHILVVGSCGGFNSNQKIAVAKKIVERDFISQQSPGKYPEWALAKPEKVFDYLTQNFAGVHYSDILSADQDLESIEDRIKWAKNFSTPVFTWESAGLIQVARQANAQYTELRFVVDYSGIPELKLWKQQLNQALSPMKSHWTKILEILHADS
jgi:nucleoside phosphorylase